MSAIRLARGYTGKNKIIKFSGCYHGHVDALLVKAGSGALTCGHPDSAGVPQAFTQETIVCPLNDMAAVEQAFSESGDDIAGVIIEPYPANCGLILPKAGYLKALRKICTKHDAVLIFDEVMTGFRLALGGVQELENITPDLTTFGKIIGGGLPVGAFGGRAAIMDCLAPSGPVYQAGTLSGNPLAMAAGIAALELLEEEDPYRQLNQIGEIIAAACQNAAEEAGVALQAPQVGSMFAFFFSEKPVTNYAEATATETKEFNKLFHYALEHGVYLAPSAYETCFISTAHTPAIIERTIDVLTQGIKAL